MNIDEKIIEWLLAGDVSIRYQVKRDLLGKNDKILRNKIDKEGWGAEYLKRQKGNGHWGRSFYFPKWISTHYTLLDLKNLCITPKNSSVHKALDLIFENEMNSTQKAITPTRIVSTDICINGMVLNYASYFQVDEDRLISIIDYLIANQMEDGGYNCHSTRIGAIHSSLHTTLSVLEGFFEYKTNGYKYRLNEINKIEKDCIEFILQHRLFKSDKTGKIINESFKRFPYPYRWRYDILRCLDYFAYSKHKYDERMKDALDFLLSKQSKEGLWKLSAKYPGKIHFEMEKAGQPSRWNTLRASRVLKHYQLL